MTTFISNRQESELLFLSSEESWHCAKVLRMKAGESIRVIDGKGNAWEATLSSVHEKECSAKITCVLPSQKKNYSLHVAIAPTKMMERIEWFAEKVTEMGVDKISFIICRNSERKVIRTDRIRKIVESAVKQSMQSIIPLVEEAISIQQFVSLSENTGSQKYIAHCSGSDKRDFTEEIKQFNDILIIIGPEGDFTTNEIELALSNNFSPVTLGSTRLRTETAGLFAAAAVKTVYDR